MIRNALLAAVMLGAVAACADNAAPVALRDPANADRGVAPTFPFAYNMYAVPNLDGNLLGIGIGPDSNVWATSDDFNEVIRMTPDGTFTESPLPTQNAIPVEITAGPDGNVWLSEFGLNAVARMTLAGQVTEFPLPASLAVNGDGPRGVITGPDGNLWVAHTGGYIVRVSPTGAVLSVYATPTPESGALILTLGPDGNLWFTESNVNQIGRITMAGAITEFAIPTPGSVPVGIVGGEDGALYFTERSASKIGRITVTGAITEFPTPTPGARPQRIVALPNGQIWFVETNSGNGQVARVLASGKNIREYPLPFSSYPFALAAEGEHTLWFTDEGGSLDKVVVADDK